MVLLLSTIEAKSTKSQELGQTLALLAKQARQMPGCLSAHGYRDVEQADSLCLVEAWATQADADVYKWMDDWIILKGATELLCVTGQVQFYTVTETEDLDAPPSQGSGQ